MVGSLPAFLGGPSGSLRVKKRQPSSQSTRGKPGRLPRAGNKGRGRGKRKSSSPFLTVLNSFFDSFFPARGAAIGAMASRGTWNSSFLSFLSSLSSAATSAAGAEASAMETSPASSVDFDFLSFFDFLGVG